MRRWLATTCVLLCAQPILAQDIYAGLGVGQARIDLDRQNIPGVSEDSDEASETFKLFGGYRFTPWLAAELTWIDLGNYGQSLDDGTFRASLDLQGYGVGASALGGFPFTPQTSLYARGGLFRWEIDADVRTNFGASDSTSEDGIDVFYGVGLEHRFTNFAVRGEWERYTNVGDDDLGGETDVDMLNASAIVFF